MAATRKIDLINGAYSQLRINGLTTGPTPFDLSTALARLENFARVLCSRNICTSYNFTENPDYNDYTNTPEMFNLMFETNLAVYLCPDFGKEPSMALMTLASSTLATASAVSAQELIQPVSQPNRMPIGSGNYRYWPYSNFYRPSPMAPSECATHTIFINDINDYTEDYTEYLNDGESISSYVMTVDPGLLLVSDSITSPVISYRVQGLSQQTSGNWQQAKIVITTSTGRVNTRLINFNVIRSQTVGGS